LPAQNDQGFLRGSVSSRVYPFQTKFQFFDSGLYISRNSAKMNI
jgi:hypothetical protein